MEHTRGPSPWLRVCVVVTTVRFIMRWTGTVHLLGAKGNCRAAWKAGIGKREGQQQRVFWKARAQQLLRLRVAWAGVWHPSHPTHALLLVVVRAYADPCSLLSNEAISSQEDAWQIALASLQPGPLAQVWRLEKSALGLERGRIWAWEDRLKLLSLAMLAHAFLLPLRDAGPLREVVRQWLLHHGCPRAGWHGRLTCLPLSRLRAALCWLWQPCLPAWALPRRRLRRRLPASLQAAVGVPIGMLS